MLLRVFVLLTLLIAAVPPAMAEDRQIGRVSASQLKSACDKAGGSFNGPTADNGAYNCFKDNCDGKGGYCQVNCPPSGPCTGTTPRQTIGAQTLVSLLQDGDLVLHDIDPTPTGSLSSPSDGGGAPAEPAAPAEPVLELF